MFWEIIRHKSILCIPLLFASSSFFLFACLYERQQSVSQSVNVPAVLWLLGPRHFSTFRLSSPRLLLSPPHTSLHFHLSVNYKLHPLMIKWTMGPSDVTERFICKTKTFFKLLTVGSSSWPPPGGELRRTCIPALYPWLNSPGWVATSPTTALSPPSILICMHTAFLTEHSTQARKDGERKKREKETKSYFYGKLRSEYGAISQVHLNKSIKAYPNMKGGKKAPTPSSHCSFLSFTFGSQNCGQAFVQVFI